MVAARTPEPRFSLGELFITPGALEVLARSDETPAAFLARHVVGDWGDVDADDRQVNEVALREGNAILSSYRTRLGNRLWVITEADRSVTTVLLPSEY
jgi:hypothetical protein